jgi:energy-coupling factor transporter ATP-binding protein EcfA2
MSDTYTLQFQNFRSLRDVSIDIAPLTVIYGPNGSGKSSVIYGLLTLRNFLTNPNQNVPSLFSYPSISLGGLQEVVHRHQANGSLSLSIGISNPGEFSSTFTLTLEQSGGAAKVALDGPVGETRPLLPFELDLPIAIPYSGNQQVGGAIEIDITPEDMKAGGKMLGPIGLALWNGITLSARLDQDADGFTEDFIGINERTNLPMELARLTGFVPLRRGFSKPTYGLSHVSPALATEDEVASLMALPAERFRQYEVSRYVERIAGRRIQTQVQVGTSMFSIDSIPSLDGVGVPISIVNEGFGINQLLYMLTICLHSPFKIVAIEEPEIHLHPSMVRKLAIALAEIASEKDRSLIVSTHSEAFVVALLSQIAAGEVGVDDVSFILAQNQGGETRLTRCEATEDGQIQGGLEAFMAGELEDLASFLGLSG